MKKWEKKSESKVGFTLVELLIVIAIIGILASVVTVSTRGGIDKSKTAAAITTMSSILPELVVCLDDNGAAIAAAAPVESTTPVCCTVSACNAVPPAKTGHTVIWPAILVKTGYAYQPPTGALATNNYKFIATKTGQNRIICDYAANSCCEDITVAQNQAGC